VRAFSGTYEEYVYMLSEHIHETQPSSAPKPVAVAATAEPERPSAREIHEEIKEQKKKMRKIEERVAGHESERETILAKMAMNPTVFSPTLTKRLHELGQLITQDEEEWFNARQAIEWLEKE